MIESSKKYIMVAILSWRKEGFPLFSVVDYDIFEEVEIDEQ